MTDKPQKPNNLGAAWCSVHQEHPDACFEKHRPDVKQVQGSLNEVQHANAIMRSHIRKQIENEDAALKAKVAEIPMVDDNA